MPNVYEGDAALGAATTPEGWANFVLDHLSNESVLLASGAQRVNTIAKQIHIPRLTDSGDAAWYTELEDIGPGDPGGEDLVLTPKKVAAITVLSNEVVADSNSGVLDTVGNAMTRSISLEADRALFVGGGSLAPSGVMNTTPTLTNVAGSITYANVVRAGGTISSYGGKPNALYLNPGDFTTLQLATAADDRPLIQSDAARGGAASVAGFTAYPTPALGAGTALVAEASQIVVAIRSDATVDFSTDAQFEKDATVARVVARVDGGVADARGLCTIHT